MYKKQKSCLSSTIPKVNEDFVPEYFIFSSEVIEGEDTQEEINKELFRQIEQMRSSLSALRMDVKDVVEDVVVTELRLGSIVQPIEVVFNNIEPFKIKSKEVVVVKTIESLKDKVYIFTGGKGTYGEGQKIVTSNNFINII